MNVDVIDYTGKFKDCVITVINILYDDEYYEATFLYKESLVVLTTEEKFEEKINCKVEDWANYKELMMMILKKVVPYNEIIKQLNEIEM